MNIIAAVDKNWAIGNKNQLLVRIPADQKFFRETTTGKVVVMGRKTLESFPNGLPLKNRTNIVLTHDESFCADGVTVCKSIEDAIARAKTEYKDEDIFFLGGESVYKEAAKFCVTAYITKIDKEYDADRFLLNFDELNDWYITGEEMIKTEKGIYITFVTYKKIIKE